MIRIEKARSEDSKVLALASWRAFDTDVNYGAPGVGGWASGLQVRPLAE